MSARRKSRCCQDAIAHHCPNGHDTVSVLTCNDRFCRDCNRRYWKPRLAALIDRALAADSYYPRERLRHAILTWRPHQITASNVRALHQAAKKWIDAGRFRWTLRALEISPTGFLHVHVLFPSEPISKRLLEARWRSICGHSWIVRYQERPPKFRTQHHPESYRRLFAYLTYYAVKLLPLSDNPRVRAALFGTRRIVTTGELFRSMPPKRKGCPVCGQPRTSSVIRLPATIPHSMIDHLFSLSRGDPARAAALLCRWSNRLSTKGKACLRGSMAKAGLGLVVNGPNLMIVDFNVKHEITPMDNHKKTIPPPPCAPLDHPPQVLHPIPIFPHPQKSKTPAPPSGPGDFPHEHQPRR